MKRDEAYKLVTDRLKNKNLVKHTLAVEAVMKALARKFGHDEDRWGLAGLLHDIDYTETADDPARHSIVGSEYVAGLGIDDEIVSAIRSHNDYHGLARDSEMAKGLYAADPVTGLIVAAALIHPDRKLASIDEQFVINRFKEKSFARGARRDAIETCTDMGLTLEEFIDVSLRAMTGIAEELGL